MTSNAFAQFSSQILLETTQVINKCKHQDETLPYGCLIVIWSQRRNTNLARWLLPDIAVVHNSVLHRPIRPNFPSQNHILIHRQHNENGWRTGARDHVLSQADALTKNKYRWIWCNHMPNLDQFWIHTIADSQDITAKFSHSDPGVILCLIYSEIYKSKEIRPSLWLGSWAFFKCT